MRSVLRRWANAAATILASMASSRARCGRGECGTKRTTDRPEQKYSLAFVGYDDEERTAVLELTYNYGVERYDLGSAFGHVAIGLPDIAKACERVRAAGGKVTREPGPVKGGTTVIAFVEDPDGYKIEFVQRKA